MLTLYFTASSLCVCGVCVWCVCVCVCVCSCVWIDNAATMMWLVSMADNGKKSDSSNKKSSSRDREPLPKGRPQKRTSSSSEGSKLCLTGVMVHYVCLGKVHLLIHKSYS